MKSLVDFIKESLEVINEVEQSSLTIKCENKTDSKWDLQEMTIDLTNGKVDLSINGIRNVVVASAYLMGKGNTQWSDEIGHKYEDYPVLQILREGTNIVYKMWNDKMTESGPVAIVEFKEAENRMKTTGRANAMLNKVFSHLNK